MDWVVDWVDEMTMLCGCITNVRDITASQQSYFTIGSSERYQVPNVNMKSIREYRFTVDSTYCPDEI